MRFNKSLANVSSARMRIKPQKSGCLQAGGRDRRSRESSEWHEVPEVKPKVQTTRFACGFIPHFFRRRFCRMNMQI